MKSRAAKGGIAAVVIAAAVVIGLPPLKQSEGLWLTAKPDRLAYNIPTVCYGETKGVKIGDTYTKAQCDEMLSPRFKHYVEQVAGCITAPDISPTTLAALGLFAYNVGAGGACRSTAIRRINAGDKPGGCAALMAWNRAGGREVPGLTARRDRERKMCLAGL